LKSVTSKSIRELDNEKVLEVADGRAWTTALLEALDFIIVANTWPVCLSCSPHRGVKASAIASHIYDEHRVLAKVLKGSKAELQELVNGLKLADKPPRFEGGVVFQKPFPGLPVLQGSCCAEHKCGEIIGRNARVEHRRHVHDNWIPCLYQQLTSTSPFIRVIEGDTVPHQSESDAEWKELEKGCLNTLADPGDPPFTFKTSRSNPPYLNHAGFDIFLGENFSNSKTREFVVNVASAPKGNDPEYGWLLPACKNALEVIAQAAMQRPFYLRAIFNGMPS
jgi:hypothetical protein